MRRLRLVAMLMVAAVGCLGFDPSAGYTGGEDPYVEQRDQAVSGFTEKGGARLQRTGWKCGDGAQSVTGSFFDTTANKNCIPTSGAGGWYCSPDCIANPSSQVRCDIVRITP